MDLARIAFNEVVDQKVNSWFTSFGHEVKSGEAVL